MKTFRSRLLGLSLFGLLAASTAAHSAPGADYLFTGDLKLGAPGFGDYLTFDPGAHRLYVSHYNKVDVVDTTTNTAVGSVGPFKEAHGVAIIDHLGKGYASDGEEGVVKVFSLADLHVIKEIKTADDSDGVAYDAKTGAVLVVAGDAHSLFIIDSRDDSVRPVALPGKPEFLVTDQRGKAFINIADLGQVAEVDLVAGKVVASWPLDNCEGAHGIAYDGSTHRLFASCSNSRLVVLDAATGRNLANLPIGQGSDAVVVDERRGLVFSSNGDGTLSVISEGKGDGYRLVRTIPTFFGGRNMAIDPLSGTLFVAHGNTILEGGKGDLLALRFGWDGLNLATFEPQP